MESKITQIRFREDTAANWASTNPILASSEPGREIDTNIFKIGDGIRHWNDLPAYDTAEIISLQNFSYNSTAVAYNGIENKLEFTGDISYTTNKSAEVTITNNKIAVNVDVNRNDLKLTTENNAIKLALSDSVTQKLNDLTQVQVITFDRYANLYDYITNSNTRSNILAFKVHVHEDLALNQVYRVGHDITNITNPPIDEIANNYLLYRNGTEITTSNFEFTPTQARLMLNDKAIIEIPLSRLSNVGVSLTPQTIIDGNYIVTYLNKNNNIDTFTSSVVDNIFNFSLIVNTKGLA